MSEESPVSWEAAVAARDAQRRLDAVAPLLLDVVRKAVVKPLTQREAAEARAIIAFTEGREPGQGGTR